MQCGTQDWAVTTVARPLRLHPDRLLPADPGVRPIARRLYEAVRDLPIISPHGHVEPSLLLDNEPFPEPATLFITPDHYVTRLLHASGIGLDELGVGRGPLERGTVPRGVAAVVLALAPLPRHTGAVVARDRARRHIRGRPDAVGRDGGLDLRPDRRATGHRRLPPSCAVRAVRDLGHGHHGRPVQRPVRACRARGRSRPGRVGSSRRSARTVTSSPRGRAGWTRWASSAEAAGRRHGRLRGLRAGARGAPPVLRRAGCRVRRSQPRRRPHRSAWSRRRPLESTERRSKATFRRPRGPRYAGTCCSRWPGCPVTTGS